MSTAKGIQIGGFLRACLSFRPNTNDAPAAELSSRHRSFFLPRRIRDPFHREDFNTQSIVDYDVFDLLVTQTRDALDNLVTAQNDYRVLQPSLLTDANGNRSEAAFDTLGMVVGTAVMGKETENKGDTLAGFNPDLDEATVLTHLENPIVDPHAILQRATTRLVYDLFAYYRTKDQPEPQPAVAYALARETHDSDLTAGAQTKIQHSFVYSDGFGREIQKKIQAEPGPVVEGGSEVSPRWVGTGWTMFNNKGKPSASTSRSSPTTHRFEFDARVGVSPILFYDPVERVVATLHPNHTWEKVVFDPWRQETWDVNDTVLVDDPATTPTWAILQPIARRRLPADVVCASGIDAGALGATEQAAARKTAVHARHPIGRPCRFARPHLPHRRPQQVRKYSERRLGRTSRRATTPGSCSTSKATSARSSTPRTASSCATTTTCSATASIRPAWRPASAGC